MTEPEDLRSLEQALADIVEKYNELPADSPERTALYRSPIRLTPYRADGLIDVEALERYVHEAYAEAGISRDAVDAALIALHRLQYITATLNTVPVLPGQLDQNKIKKSEFRLEHATLTQFAAARAQGGPP